MYSLQHVIPDNRSQFEWRLVRPIFVVLFVTGILPYYTIIGLAPARSSRQLYGSTSDDTEIFYARPVDKFSVLLPPTSEQMSEWLCISHP